MKLGFIGRLFPLMFRKVVYGYTAETVPEYYVTHRECGVCKIGQQENLMFLTPHMCVMDYPTIEYKGGVSDFVREYTLASGGPYCDCGYKKKRG